MSKFQLIFEPPSLYRLSEVGICKSLWTQFEVKKTLENKFEDSPQVLRLMGCDIPDNLLGLLDKDQEILSQVNSNIDKLHLPSEPKSKLKALARAIGIMIYKWLLKIKSECEHLPAKLLDYIDHIKWTSEGNIDTSETLRSMYYSKLFPDSWDTWMKLSSYCLEDCLANMHERIDSLELLASNGDRKAKPQTRAQVSEYLLTKYWSSRFTNLVEQFTSNLNSAPDHLEFVDKSEPLNVNMLWMAIWHNNFAATKYFWESLTEEQRPKAFSKISQRPQMYNRLELYIPPTRGVDIVFYLWKQVTIYGDDKFLIDILRDVDVMPEIFKWPWEDLFMKALEGVWPRLDGADLRKMLYSIYETVHGSTNGKTNIIKIFNEIWTRMDDASKKSLNLDLDFLVDELDCLNIIINDPVFVDERRTILSQVVNAYENLKVHLESELMDKFCTQVLKDDEERAWFKTQCSRYDAGNVTRHWKMIAKIDLRGHFL